MITVCVIETDGTVRFPETEADFEAVKKEAGIGFAEVIPGTTPEAFALCDEDGRLMGLDYNALASLLWLTDLVGPVVIAGGNVDRITDCPESIGMVVRQAQQRI